MRRLIVIMTLILAAGGLTATAQERGVEFSFVPTISDTTAGSLLYFELVAKDGQGDIITDWETTGEPVRIEVLNSTANTDTSVQTWSQNKLGYTFARMFEPSGGEIATLPASPNVFYIPRELFSNGELQIAFSHSKAESDVYLKITPRKVSSDFQTSPMYTFVPGNINNFFVDITGQTPSDNQVFKQRYFELVIAPRDRFLNVVYREADIAFTARFPGELYPLGGALPTVANGMTSVMLLPTETRLIANEDLLQDISIYHPSLIGIEGRSDKFEILDHSPSGFTLNSPPSGTEIPLRNWQDIVRFDWNAAVDPYTNIQVSRFDGKLVSDTIRYRLFIADYNSLTTRVSFLADEDGRATSLDLSHWTLAEAARTLHGDGAVRLNAVWSVTATDGLYSVESTSANSPTEAGHTLQADLLTLDVERLEMTASNYTLNQNYPNPFTLATTIDYTVPERTPVRIQVFDVYGSLVATLVDNHADPGSYRVVWNGRTDHGSNAPAGTYILSMTAGPYSQTRVMSLIQ